MHIVVVMVINLNNFIAKGRLNLLKLNLSTIIDAQMPKWWNLGFALLTVFMIIFSIFIILN